MKHCLENKTRKGMEIDMMISGNLRPNNQDYGYQDYINHDRSGVTMSEKSKEIREELNDLLVNELGVSEEELKEKRWESTHKSNQGAPYSYLADENGIVEYKGVVFVCDNQKKELQLGDMSNSKDVIRIPLSNGGSLAVNRDNIGDLGHAIGMFSPEDVKLILRALSLDAKVQEMEQETEDMEDGIGKDQKERVEGEKKESEEAALPLLREASFSIGGTKFTNKEWNKLIEKVDVFLDDVRSKITEEEEQREKKRTQKEIRENTDAVKDFMTKDMGNTNELELSEEILNQLFAQAE